MDEILIENVQDLRLRLKMTEKTLDNIHALEKRHGPLLDRAGSVTSIPSHNMEALRLEDLSPEQPNRQLHRNGHPLPSQEIPNSHRHSQKSIITSPRHMSQQNAYGFYDHNQDFRQRPSWKQLEFEQQQPTVQGFELHESRSSQGSNSLHQSHYSRPQSGEKIEKIASVMSYSGEAANSSINSDGLQQAGKMTSIQLSGELGALEMNNESLRQKLQHVREENFHMVTQNHKMMNDMESLNSQHLQTNVKVQRMESELKRSQTHVMALEETVTSLRTEKEQQLLANRAVEERCSSMQRGMKEQEEELERLTTELQSHHQQLLQLNAVKERLTNERDLALDSAEGLQQKLQDFQSRTKEKIKMFEQSEDLWKEKLDHADSERSTLLSNMASLNRQMQSLQEEIRHFQDESSLEKDARTDVEQHNVELRTQAARQVKQIGRLEVELKHLESVRQENSTLQDTVKEHANSLEQCKAHITYSRAQMAQLEQLATQLQQRANKKHHVTQSDSEGSYQELGSATESGLHNTIQELRLEVSKRDGEISELNNSLKKQQQIQEKQPQQHLVSQQASHDGSNTSSIGSLKKELAAMTVCSKHEEQRCEELEELVSRLEEERFRHTHQVASLEARLSDLEVNGTLQQSRLDQRTTQLTDLQAEVNERVTQVTSLERELRKKNSQMTTLERQLDEKVLEVAECVSRMSELEDDVEKNHCLYDSAQKRLEDQERQTLQTTTTTEKLTALHVEQCREMEQQIEQLSEQCEVGEKEMRQLRQQLDYFQHEVASKDAILRDLQSELQRRSMQSEQMVSALEQQASAATTRIRELEGATVVCREEIRVQLEHLEGEKQSCNKELTDKDCRIVELETALNKAHHSEADFSEKHTQLQQHAEELTTQLQQSATQVTELEADITQLHLKMSSAQKSLQQAEAHLAEVNEEHEQEMTALTKKLEASCGDLARKDAQILELTETIRDLQWDKTCLTTDIKDLNKKIQQEQQEVVSMETKMGEMEKEIRKLRATIRNKDELIGDVEHSLARTQDELNDRSQRATELYKQQQDTQSVNSQIQAELERMQGEYAELQDQLHLSQAELKQRDEHIENYKQTARRCQDETRSHQQEVEQNQVALKQQQWQLQQRAAQVTQLEMVYKEQKSELEQQVAQLEGTLKKSELEVQKRGLQVTDLDDQLKEAHKQLREAGLQLQQRHLESERQQQELHTRTVGIEKLAQALENLQDQVSDAKTKNAAIIRDNVTNKDHVAHLQLELSEIATERGVLQRENSRLSKELTELTTRTKTRDEEVLQLKADHANLTTDKLAGDTEHKVKVGQLQRELKTKSRDLQAELSRLRTRNQHEAQQWQADNSKLFNKVEELQKKLKQTGDKSQASNQAIQRLQVEVSSLQTELTATRSLLEDSNNTRLLKDSEVARLETKVSSLQRAAFTTAPPLDKLTHPSDGSTGLPPISTDDAINSNDNTNTNTNCSTQWPSVTVAQSKLPLSDSQLLGGGITGIPMMNNMPLQFLQGTIIPPEQVQFNGQPQGLRRSMSDQSIHSIGRPAGFLPIEPAPPGFQDQGLYLPQYLTKGPVDSTLPQFVHQPGSVFSDVTSQQQGLFSNIDKNARSLNQSRPFQDFSRIQLAQMRDMPAPLLQTLSQDQVNDAAVTNVQKSLTTSNTGPADLEKLKQDSYVHDADSLQGLLKEIHSASDKNETNSSMSSMMPPPVSHFKYDQNSHVTQTSVIPNQFSGIKIGDGCLSQELINQRQAYAYQTCITTPHQSQYSNIPVHMSQGTNYVPPPLQSDDSSYPPLLPKETKIGQPLTTEGKSSHLSSTLSSKSKSVSTKHDPRNVLRRESTSVMKDGPSHSSPQATKRSSRLKIFGGKQKPHKSSKPAVGTKQQDKMIYKGARSNIQHNSNRSRDSRDSLGNVSTAVSHYQCPEVQSEQTTEENNQTGNSSSGHSEKGSVPEQHLGYALHSDDNCVVIESNDVSKISRSVSFPEGLDLSSIVADGSMQHQLVQMKQESTQKAQRPTLGNATAQTCVSALEERRRALQQRQRELGSQLEAVDSQMATWD